MGQKTFLSRMHFNIYDSIIPVFRVVVISILIGYTIFFNETSRLGWDFGFALFYMLYALLLLSWKGLREVIVFKYPVVVGLCETLIITYGIARTGGASSPMFYAYILVVTFFGIVHHYRSMVAVTLFSDFSYLLVVFFSGDHVQSRVVFNVLYLMIFALFVGLVNGSIWKYNKKIAVMDQLTGLYNRQYLFGELDRLFTEGKKASECFAIMVIDVNDFKKINDIGGHLEGDRILKSIGTLLKEVAGEDEIPARYGGDEFVVLLKKAGRTQAEYFRDRLNQVVEAYFKGHVRISAGCAVYPEDGKDVEKLFQAADSEMYRVKKEMAKSV